MATIAEQLAALSVLDTLKHSVVPGSMSNLPWQTAVGTWTEATGWNPSSFVTNAPTNTRSGLYINTGKVSGDYGLGLKKTTGSLAAVERQFEVWLFYQGGEKPSGYQLRVISEASGKVQYKLTKWVEGEGTVLIESAKELTFAENDSFFIARVGKSLAIYHRTGEGAAEIVGKEVEDSTFTEGYVGFGGNGSNPKLINLQGGALKVPETIRKFIENEEIVTAKGSLETLLASSSDMTLAILCRPNSTALGRLLVSGTCTIFSSNLSPVFNTKEPEAGCKLEEGQWNLLVITKVGGNTKPRFHLYKVKGKTWEHSSSATAFSEAPHGGAMEFAGLTGVVWAKVEIAAVAAFNRALSDAEVEALASVSALGKWGAIANVIGLWFFNQAVNTEEVKDLVGTANQSKRLGTTVVNEAPPIPYGELTLGKFIKVLIGGSVKEVKRWVLVGGSLVNK